MEFAFVADAFFSKETYVSGAKTLGFDIISRLRDEIRLKYLYVGPKAGKRGRPKRFTSPVDLKFLDKSVFETDTLEGVIQ
ncbi:MAG: hypothetical protein ACI4TU_00410 [Candidatus Cryptobacteroides sp.]